MQIIILSFQNHELYKLVPVQTGGSKDQEPSFIHVLSKSPSYAKPSLQTYLCTSPNVYETLPSTISVLLPLLGLLHSMQKENNK